MGQEILDSLGYGAIDEVELARDCELYLDHRFIPLRSHCRLKIIEQAIREGYQLEKFGIEIYVGPLT